MPKATSAAPATKSSRNVKDKSPVKRKDGKPTMADRKAANKAAWEKARKVAQGKKPPMPDKIPLTKDNPLRISGEWDREAAMKIICEKVASSTKSLFRILREGHDGYALPDYSSVVAWKRDDQSLARMYADAKAEQAHFMGEEIIDIADDGTNDFATRVDPRTGNEYEMLDSEHVQRSKLRIETRKWLMGKLRPRTYGDKLAIGGADDLPPIKVDTETLKNMSLEELKELAKKLEDAGVSDGD